MVRIRPTQQFPILRAICELCGKKRKITLMIAQGRRGRLGKEIYRCRNCNEENRRYGRTALPT